MSVKISSKQQVQEFLDKYDTFLFDCDGVLWRGSQLIPYSADTLKLLRDHGKQLIFVTNNSTKSRKAYSQKFNKLGLDVNPDEIFCSAYSAAVYLDRVVKFPKDKKVFIVGQKGIEEELHDVGISYLGGEDPKFNQPITDELTDTITRDHSIGCVLAGLDTHINYYKIAYAQAQLQDPETLFLATNIDSTFPSHGKLLPGAGTVIQAVATAAGREPAAALGKPNQAMMDCIKARFNFDPKRAVMVGDRLNTDMEFGVKGGLGTLFVLSGVDSQQALENNPPVTPEYYASKLGDLYELYALDK